MLGKFFSRVPSVRKIKSVVDEILRRNLLLSDKIVDRHFVIVKTNVFGTDGGRLVLGLFHISSM